MLTDSLESGKLNPENEQKYLKFLIHLVSDIHQPLHIGNGSDRGGNDLLIHCFEQPSNLHRVWDSDIIDSQQLSYTEYGQHLNRFQNDQVREWQNSVENDLGVPFLRQVGLSAPSPRLNGKIIPGYNTTEFRAN